MIPSQAVPPERYAEGESTWNDHDLLIRLDERIAEILAWTKNHDSRHAKIESRLAALGTGMAVAAAGAVIAYILRLL